MARILITSGPTRQYIDPVRYLTNASSGRMGAALANTIIELGHELVIVSGPVEVDYPEQAEVIRVLTTEEMLSQSQLEFARCDGMIGVAAPCDYRPIRVSDQKISKTGEPLVLHLVETPDIVATLGASKRNDQWVVGFALETDDHRFRATVKLEKKSCDLIVLNGPDAMNSHTNSIEVLNRQGDVLLACTGSKQEVADAIMDIVGRELLGI